jgi:hypothetical protein
MRRVRLLICAAGISFTAATVGANWLSTSAAASSTTVADLPLNYVVCPAGRPISLQAVTYQASKFPIPLRVTIPDRSWSGGQWKTGSNTCGPSEGKFIGYAPFYGWVELNQGPATQFPRGSIVIMSSYSWTPSVQSAVQLLRADGTEVTYEATTAVKVAGFSGSQVDGTVVGKAHQFFPFTSPHRAKGDHPDGIEMEHGWVFRIIVLKVRGKTVVVYIANVGLPASQFLAFLTRANRVLRTLSFPKGA